MSLSAEVVSITPTRPRRQRPMTGTYVRRHARLSSRRASVAMVGGCLLLPALAPLLNHWSFRDTTVPLLFLGLALAGCVMLARHGTAPSRQPAMPIAREVAWIALAVTMPAFVLLPGWPAATGDEPHYLLAARSLVTDGDLDLAADYDEERYVPYWLGPLSPHTKPGVDPTTEDDPGVVEGRW